MGKPHGNESVNALASGSPRLKSSSLPMFLHKNISADDWARERFKTSNDLASLHVCNENLILGFVFL